MTLLRLPEEHQNEGRLAAKLTFVSWGFATRDRVFLHDVTAAILESENNKTAAMLVSQNNETAAMLVSQTNPVGVELLSYANAFVCSNKFGKLLAT